MTIEKKWAPSICECRYYTPPVSSHLSLLSIPLLHPTHQPDGPGPARTRHGRRPPPRRVAKRPLHSKRAEAAQSPGTLILAKAPQLQADFSRPRGGKRGGFVGKAHRPKAQRFPQNPEADWGPKARARHAPPAAAAAAAPTTAAPEVAPGHENAEEANACDAEPASKKAKF